MIRADCSDTSHSLRANVKVESRAGAAIGGIARLLLALALVGIRDARGSTGPSTAPPCTEDDYRFAYTECDDAGTRWRVAIPISSLPCTGRPDPTLGTNCNFSCSVGEYLDMQNQSCARCMPGTFSLGSGVRFDDWSDIPSGFTLHSGMPDFVQHPAASGQARCQQSMWTSRGGFLMSNRDECSASLIYTANLKKAGKVTFEYQYPDAAIIFEFFVQNDQCHAVRSNTTRQLPPSKSGHWTVHQQNLDSGSNVLFWKTTGVPQTARLPNPILLRNIHITGVSYTSVCSPCKPGTFNKRPGSSSCFPCPRDTFSGHGATRCLSCDSNTEFAEPGSASCSPRPACTQSDYFHLHSSCDHNGMTRVTYRWVKPKVCREDLPGAIILPMPTKRLPCPPCNPGFSNMANGTCTPCPPGSVSDGIEDCRQCPAGTEPEPGIEYKWWNVLPDNMASSCFNLGNSKCHAENGWEVAGDHIHSGSGSSDTDYLILFLRTSGFRPQVTGGNQAGEGADAGSISFVFDIQCHNDCELHFMLEYNNKTMMVKSWMGSQDKQLFKHSINSFEPVTFTWVFQRTGLATQNHRFILDAARLFSINITNIVGQVASRCRLCALEEQRTCVPCLPGRYVDPDTRLCRPCPFGFYLDPARTPGPDACQRCGPGTRSSAGRNLAVCMDNVTQSESSTRNGDGNGEGSGGRTVVKTIVCRETLIPIGPSSRGPLSAQPLSLADHLVGVSMARSLDNITVPSNVFPLHGEVFPDVIFYYRSSIFNQNCEHGQAVTVHLRCRLDAPGKGTLSLSRECPTGTCDGCTYHILWQSRQACPLCTKSDYTKIVGACKHGKQKTTYVLRNVANCRDGLRLPQEHAGLCQPLGLVIKAAIGVASGIACLLVALVVHFWRKNRNLEYKYSRLVLGAGGRDEEATVVDSCGLFEGEDNDDDLMVAGKGERSLLGRIKSLASKDRDGNFDSVQLKVSTRQAST
uniref:Si:ch211-233h19.2 n=1 Tax=Eptatretus burgeri TaxID=7764 RepID=A0A8C4QAW0_EPTBU